MKKEVESVPVTKAQIYLPSAVRSGMYRKFDEAIRNPVDGNPATRGTPMEAEARYYHNFYMAAADIPFEDFVTALCRDLSAVLPAIGTTPDWIRECDRWSAIGTARRELAKLRATAERGRTFRVSFWGMLWKITEVYLEKFKLSCRELGTTLNELSGLARGYLLHQCSVQVNRLRALLSDSVTTDTRASFVTVDNMLRGIPLPLGGFLADGHNHATPTGAYALYRRTLEERPIEPESVGWSLIEHRRCELLVFPQGRPCDPVESLPETDPTAQAVEYCTEASPEPMGRPVSTEHQSRWREKPMSHWVDAAEESLSRLLGLKAPGPQAA